MTCAFFYGLFMDVDLLRGMSLAPVLVGPARVRGYELRIGDKATLIPSARGTAYGMLIELSDDELQALYSAPGVRDYRPIEIEAQRLDSGATHVALCYNLSADRLAVEFNADYAQRLADVLLSLGFPRDYARSVRQSDSGLAGKT